MSFEHSWSAMMFSTGFGDSVYPVFVGYTGKSDAGVVLVDCDILPWPE